MRAKPTDHPIVLAWRRHNDITFIILGHLSPAGLKVVPTGSRGRTVAEQLIHMNNVRLGWLSYQSTGRRPQRVNLPACRPTRLALERAFRRSGHTVATFLSAALAGNARVRMFGADPIRFFTYLVSHEAHHRGQIALALKQAGLRLPETVALRGFWGTWFLGS